MFLYLQQLLRAHVGKGTNRHFVAETEAHSYLGDVGRDYSFRDLVAAPPAIPGASYSFGQFYQVLCLSEYETLVHWERPVIRLHTTGDPSEAFEQLLQLFRRVLHRLRSGTQTFFSFRRGRESVIPRWLPWRSPVVQITTLFWDIGGVVLTNGWDHNSRMEATQAFGLDWEEFRERHDLSFPAFDAGQITLNQYLDRTLFYRPRSFTREEFTAFMFARSKEYPDTRAVLNALAASGRYYVASINNEPRELNDYRIEAFALRKDFQAFFSSCYLGARKPEETIYRIALEVSQRPPENSVFIDDRPLNLESPRRLGMHVIHHQNAKQLRADLQSLGITV